MQQLVQSTLEEHYDKLRLMYNCVRCKTQFESIFHLENHLCEGKSRYRGKPRLRLQNLHDAVILSIARHLSLLDLVSFIDALPRLMIIHGLRKVWLGKYSARKIQQDRVDYQYFSLENYQNKNESYSMVDRRGFLLISLHKSVHRYAMHEIILRASKRIEYPYQTRSCQHCEKCKQFCLFRKRRFQVERKINECEQRFNCCGSSWD